MQKFPFGPFQLERFACHDQQLPEQPTERFNIVSVVNWDSTGPLCVLAAVLLDIIHQFVKYIIIN